MHLDFRQLRNFVALVEYGSFNRAAEAVCLSQSAFSRSIQALEQSVGHPLFDRQSKLPTLTLHGQTLLPYARRFQALNVELSSQMREAEEALTGEVMFGCGPAPSARLIPAAVGAFHRSMPQAKVRFQPLSVRRRRQLAGRTRSPASRSAAEPAALLLYLPRRSPAGEGGPRLRPDHAPLSVCRTLFAARRAQSAGNPERAAGFFAGNSV